ncbi:MAG: RIP metalloprotease RseP [Myxococcota bacterium]
MGILAGLLLLCILVVVHEFGHFWVAKMLGVRVLTFSVGFGPKLVKTVRGGTEYALSLFPFGGYVKMLGESPDEELTPEEKKKSFLGQPLWKKSLIALAGPFFNLILPLFLFFGIAVGSQEIYKPVIGQVIEDKAAFNAGLHAGDLVLAIDNKPIQTFGDLVKQVSAHPNQKLAFEVDRDGEKKVIDVTPDAEPDPNPLHKNKTIGRIGVALGDNPQTGRIQVGVFEAMRLAVVQTVDIIELTLLSLWMLVSLEVSPKELGGPLMIIGVASQAATQGLAYYLQLMALISVNLGLLNLLPVPVLDGGHLLMFAIEGATGRPLSTRVRQILTQAGMFLLLGLMALALFNDVLRLVK